MKKILIITLVVSLALPLAFAFADQTGTGRTTTGPTFPGGTTYGRTIDCYGGNIQGILICVGQLFERLIPITVGLALLYFIWGVFKIIRAQGDTGKIEEGRKIVFWGLIALFVMVSIGGLIAFIYGDFLGGIPNTIPTN